MPRVVIDDIEYVPRAEIPPLDDDKLTEALKELVSLYYFGVFGKECVQILGVGIESGCCDSDYSEHKGTDNGIRKLSY